MTAPGANPPGGDRAPRETPQRAPDRDERQRGEARTDRGTDRAEQTRRARPKRPAARRRRTEREHPHRLRRYSLRALMVIAALVLLAVIAVEIVLHTAVPRNLVVSSLERQFGLRIAASSMSTGWLGHTTLHDVTLALPLADESFLEVPRLSVDHTNLFMLLLTRKLHIDSIELDQPRLTVRQNPQGQWNIDEVMRLVLRAGGGKSAAAEQAQAAPEAQPLVQLPGVRVKDGTVLIVDNNGSTSQIKGLEVLGVPQSPVAWTLSLKAPDVDVEGRVAPGSAWQHSVAFKVAHVKELLGPWLGGAPSPLRAEGRWRGSLNDGDVEGRLDLTSSQMGPVGLVGAIDVREAGGGATLVPQTLVASVTSASQTPIRFMGGSFALQGTRIKAQQVRAGVMGGAVRLDGEFDWHALTGTIDAAWRDLALPGDGQTSGSMKGNLDMPWANRPRITAQVNSTGAARGRRWDGTLQVTGQGSSWKQIDWTIQAPRVKFVGPKHTGDIQDLGMRLLLDWPKLRLADLHLARTNRINGEGEMNFESKTWWTNLDLRQLEIPGITRSVDLLARASGTPQRVTIEQLDWTAGKSHVEVAGSYEFARPRPLDATVRLTRLPVAVSNAQRSVLPAGSAGLHGEGRAVGTVLPLDVDLDGQLNGKDVFLGKRQLGDLTVRVNGHVGAEAASFRSQEIKLLGGEWGIDGRYDYDQALATLDVAVRKLSLQQFDALVQPPPDAQGTLSADLHLEWPREKGEQTSASGHWVISDLKKGAFQARKASGKLKLEGDELTVSEIALEQGKGRMAGKLEYNLRKREHLAVQVRGQEWPVELPGARGSLTVSGDTRLNVDLAHKAATGPVSLSGSAVIRQQYFGSGSITAQMRGQELEVSSLRADAFGGTMQGNGVIAVDDWTRSAGHFEVQGVESTQVVQMWPAARGLAGTFSGTVDVRRNGDPHSTEPLAADVRLTPLNAHYNAARINQISLSFVAGPQRVILSNGLFYVADGEIAAWGRLSRHPDEIIGHTQIELHNLNIDQVVHAVSTTTRTTAGIIDGEITAFGPIDRKRQINGEANLRFSRMGLLNLDLLAAMYSSLNPGAAPPPARGRGVAYLRLEQGTLSLVNGFYRNQGIYVRMQAQVKDVFRAGSSPISGFAVGTARPLSQIKLPFLAQVDDILSALQHAVTTFRIGGTAGHPRLQPAGFNDVGEGLKRLFVDDVKQEVGVSVGR